MPTSATPSKCVDDPTLTARTPAGYCAPPCVSREPLGCERTRLIVLHVNPHGHVIAHRSPRLEGANSEVRDALHPATRQEDVVQVKRPLFPVPEIIGGAS